MHNHVRPADVLVLSPKTQSTLPCELPPGTAGKGQKAMAVVNPRQKTAIPSCCSGAAQHLHHSADIFISSGLSLGDLGGGGTKRKVKSKT